MKVFFKEVKKIAKKLGVKSFMIVADGWMIVDNNGDKVISELEKQFDNIVESNKDK